MCCWQGSADIDCKEPYPLVAAQRTHPDMHRLPSNPLRTLSHTPLPHTRRRLRTCILAALRLGKPSMKLFRSRSLASSSSNFSRLAFSSAAAAPLVAPPRLLTRSSIFLIWS